MKVILADKTEFECDRFQTTNNAGKQSGGESGYLAWITMDNEKVDENDVIAAFTNDNIKSVTFEREDGLKKTYSFTEVDNIGTTLNEYTNEVRVTLK